MEVLPEEKLLYFGTPGDGKAHIQIFTVFLLFVSIWKSSISAFGKKKKFNFSIEVNSCRIPETFVPFLTTCVVQVKLLRVWELRQKICLYL